MQIGEKYAMRWKYPHRLEVTVLELRDEYLIAETVHRCPVVSCYLQTMRNTLPIHGRQRYEYPAFAKLFQPIPEGSIPLPPSR